MRLNAINAAINRLNSIGRTTPSLISRLFPSGTKGFASGLSVTEAYQKGYLFQDAAGTTPAALEQPVGKVVGEVGGINATQSTSTKRPTLSARVNLLTATATLSTQSVTTQATNYVLSFSGAGTVTLSGTATGAKSAGSNTITCNAGTLTLTVSGSVTNADLRPANLGTALPAYQRVNTATDYDTVGFPYYLDFNGVDRWLVTSSIDLTGTDKATVFAGVRKLTDSGYGGIVEFSTEVASNNGSFLIRGPEAGANYLVGAKASAAVYRTLTTYTAPISNVICVKAELSTPRLETRINGGSVDVSTTSMGSGNFGTYPLYFGARAGSSLFFSGHMYTLPIIVGSAVSASLIAQVEASINKSMGTIY